MNQKYFQLKIGQHQAAETGAKNRSCLSVFNFAKGQGFIFSLLKTEKKHSRELRLLCDLLSRQAQQASQNIGPENSPQQAFEEFLAKANRNIAETIQSESWFFPPEDLHSIVGLAAEQQMYLSGTGELSAVFLHQTKDGQYQVFDLSRNLAAQQPLPTWEKTFSVILDGDLNQGDVFCLLSEPAKSVLANHDLHEILTLLPAQSAALKIPQYFPHNLVPSVLVVKAQDPQARPGSKPASPTIAPEGSIKRLAETLDQTSKLLKDQRPNNPLPLLKSLKDRLIKKRKSRESAEAGGTRLLKKLAGLLGRRWLLSKFKKANPFKNAPEKIKRAKQRAVYALSALPRKKSVFSRLSIWLFLAAFCVLIALGVGIFLQARQSEKSQNQADVQSRLAAVNSKIEQAAAAEIYQDEKQAREFYEEALALAKQLLENSENPAEEISGLMLEINQGLDRLRRITKINDPQLLADFLEPEDFLRAEVLNLISGQISVFTNNKEVYAFASDSGKLEKIISAEPELGIPVAGAADGKNLWLLDNRPGLSQISVEPPSLRLINLTANQNSQWLDLEIYADKIYVLQFDENKQDSQIMRFDKTNSGLSSGVPWITSKSSTLRDAVSLAIDGTIFVLNSNGQIIRFSRSSEIGWSADPIDPPMTKAAKIWTDAESDYLYVLDPLGRRVIVYQKENGQIVTQYVMENLNNLKDMLVDEAGQKIYLLTEKALYSINQK